MDVVDLIPSYPKTSNLNFGFDIFRKKEFYDLRLNPFEDKPKDVGVPLSHQQMQQRFFSPHTDYDSGLIVHDVGTGKSCTTSFIVENFKVYRTRRSANIENQFPAFRPAIVLVPSEILEHNIRREIADVCTKNLYEPKRTAREKRRGEELTDIQKIRRLKKEVEKTYKVTTYYNFLKHEIGDVSKEALIERYKNRVIIIDEAHRIRMREKKDMKFDMYKHLYDFLHVVMTAGCRILLLTATPIWDIVYEAFYLFNLILPEDLLLPTGSDLESFFDKNDDLTEEAKERLKEALRGRISFIRQMTSTAKKIYEGTSKPWFKHIKVYPSVMSKFQAKAAAKAKTEVVITKKEIEKEGKIVEVERKTVGGAIRLTARDASVFVFPDGSYGRKGMDKYVNTKKGRYSYKSHSILKQINDDISKYSSIYASVIWWLDNHPNEVAYIHSDSVVAGGGSLVNFALILQQHGYEWAREASSLKSPDKGKGKLVVLTSLTASSKKVSEMLKIIGDPKNRYGKYCRIVMGSRTISTGVTIKNVRQVHNISGHWNFSAGDQVLGRVYRIGTHDAFPSKERYLRIFQHVAVEKGTALKDHNISVGYPLDAGFSKKKSTIGLEIYDIAEKKDIRNSQLIRFIKEISWDCALTYKRNVLKSDIDGSRDCNYEECNYVCDDFPEKYIDKSQKVWEYDVSPDKIDYTTYNLFYSNEEVDKLIEHIKKLFSENYAYMFDDMYSSLRTKKHLGDVDHPSERSNKRVLLLMACNKMIDERIPILDRLGVECYLKEQNNMFYLSRDFSTKPSYFDIFYTQTPMITESIPIMWLVQMFQLQRDKKKLVSLCKHPSAEKVDELNYRTLILLLEMGQKLLWRREKGEKLSSRENKAADIIDETIANKYLVPTLTGEFLHDMYAPLFTGRGFEAEVKTMKPTGWMRIFDPQTGEWGFVGKENEKNYFDLFKKEEKKRVEIEVEDNPYGMIGMVKGGKFAIARTKEKGGGGSGRVCGSIKIPDLVEIMREIEVFPPVHSTIPKEKKSTLIKYIMNSAGLKAFHDKEYLQSKDEEIIKRILSISKTKRADLCSLIEKKFKEIGVYRY
jgi:hypothetical protein